MIGFSEFLNEDTAARLKALQKQLHDRLEKRDGHAVNWRAIEMTIPSYFNWLLEMDPTPQKKYMQWLINLWVDQPGATRMLEDTAAIRIAIETFERVKQRLPQDQRDISKYQSYHTLIRVMAPYEEAKSQRQIDKEEADRIRRDIQVVYKDPNVIVSIPKTEEASNFLGRGTKWCTAATKGRNYFRDYSSRGPLFVVQYSDGVMYQYHADADPPLYPERDQAENEKEYEQQCIMAAWEWIGTMQYADKLDSNQIKILAGYLAGQPFIKQLASKYPGSFVPLYLYTGNLTFARSLASKAGYADFINTAVFAFGGPHSFSKVTF